MQGIQLAARFSIATNRLKYCGPADAEPALFRTIADAGSMAASRTTLLKSRAMEPHPTSIALEHSSLPPR